MTIRSVVRTDKGLVRKNNEDSVGVLPGQGLVALADGMGGHSAGEVASSLAVETITQSITSNSTVSPAAAIELANSAILKMIQDNSTLQGMATTAVVGCFYDGIVDYAHVGDSRLYLWRGSELKQLTRDHSMIQALVDDGLYASLKDALKDGVKSNLLTRGVGIGEELLVDSGRLTLCPGDLYVFCTDGLSNMLPDGLIERVLSKYSGQIDAAADQLLGLALKRGGYDNISVALIEPTQPRG
ncbi:MAG: serine/threonine-protein phosphatase [Gammaproteobacteria bacterium]|nr:serine/threonine-protein phosphatase [Gammaproteobacteria bacterium]